MQSKLFFIIIFIAFPAHAHTFTGMIGFYDGLSHPVLGMDHFLAMVSVGIVSAQIGGRAIWRVPAMFVTFMIIGGALGIGAEFEKGFGDQAIYTNQTSTLNYFADYVYIIIELGIFLSVILLGAAIAIEKKLPISITMIFVSFFGLCHGAAHGLEMPWAANPVLFALGFVAGTTTLHLFGVGIGSFATKTAISSFLLRCIGVGCLVYGFYLLISLA
ncbi:HupE/UreJ family protein [Alphaproteobacteria bacterium]|nr:HupE/UreJ family protein [Alphaproteobacteria bacterium]